MQKFNNFQELGNFYFKKDRATWRGRPDGRQPDELRPVEIRLHYLRYAEGSVLVEAGNNRIICAASVEDRVLLFCAIVVKAGLLQNILCSPVPPPPVVCENL